jgi:hypothetical protein
MAEILTESFCERCGTRYTFESPARRSNPLGALGTVSRGIRNFVVSPDQSIDEAFAVARLENEQKATAHQLEAFHQTFNFCLSCRQYTCSNCWNGVEGRCQSCAPMPEAEALPAYDTDLESPVVAEAMAIARAAAMPVMEVPLEFQTPSAEPVVDAPASEVADEPEAIIAEPEAIVAEPDAAGAEPEIEEDAPAIEPEAIVAEPDLDLAEAEAAAEAEALEAEALEPEAPEPEALRSETLAHDGDVDVDLPDAHVHDDHGAGMAIDAATAAEPATNGTPELPAFPPGISLDEEIAAYEMRVAELSTPAATTEAEPEAPAEAEAEPEPQAVELPPAVAPPSAEPLSWPVRDTLRAAASTHDLEAEVPKPRVVAYAPDLPAVSPVVLPAAQSTGSCPACGLALSATARFCRRCGTAQQQAGA